MGPPIRKNGEEEGSVRLFRNCARDRMTVSPTKLIDNSIDINIGPKIGPRCKIENWPIGRPRQAYAHWQNLPEFWPENWPEIVYVN